MPNIALYENPITGKIETRDVYDVPVKRNGREEERNITQKIAEKARKRIESGDNEIYFSGILPESLKESRQ